MNEIVIEGLDWLLGLGGERLRDQVIAIARRHLRRWDLSDAPALLGELLKVESEQEVVERVLGWQVTLSSETELLDNLRTIVFDPDIERVQSTTGKPLGLSEQAFLRVVKLVKPLVEQLSYTIPQGESALGRADRELTHFVSMYDEPISRLCSVFGVSLELLPTILTDLKLVDPPIAARYLELKNL